MGGGGGGGGEDTGVRGSGGPATRGKWPSGRVPTLLAAGQRGRLIEDPTSDGGLIVVRTCYARASKSYRTWSFQDMVVPGHGRTGHGRSGTWSFRDMVVPGHGRSGTWSFQDMVVQDMVVQDMVVPGHGRSNSTKDRYHRRYRVGPCRRPPAAGSGIQSIHLSLEWNVSLRMRIPA